MLNMSSPVSSSGQNIERDKFTKKYQIISIH